MKFLLYLKSWQLFIIFIIGLIFYGDSSYGMYAGLLCWVVYIGWLYHISVAMYEIMPIQYRPGIKYFKLSCLFILMMLAIGIIAPVYSLFPQNSIVGEIIDIIVGCYIAWSWLYITLFTARLVESSIQGKLVYRSDSLKAFIYLFVFPLGVWYIQPAVQRVLKHYSPNT